MDELIEDINNQQEYNRVQILRRVRDRMNPFEYFDDISFRSRFRFTKRSVMRLTDIVSDEIEHRTQRNGALCPLLQVLLALRFFATGAFLAVMGDVIHVHAATVSRTVHRVARAFARAKPQFIQFPQGHQLIEMKNLFAEMAGFPGVVGAIDCTHVKILSPGGADAELYRNRKGFFSLNVQVVSDAALKIRSIVARWCGSTHDARIWDNCAMSIRFENGQINGILLGDNGYPSLPYLMTPILNPNTRPERRYNVAHKTTRNSVERTFGLLKRRFPCLQQCLRFSPERSATIVVAVAVLHNLARELAEYEFEDEILEVNDDDDIQAGIEINNRRGINVRAAFIQQHFT